MLLTSFVNSSVGKTVQRIFHLRQNAFVSYVCGISYATKEGRSYLLNGWGIACML